MLKRIFLFMLIFAFSMTVVSIEAYAQPVTNPPGFMTRVKNFGDGVAKKAQKIGEKVKKFAQKTYQGAVAEAKKWKEKADDTVNNARDKVMGNKLVTEAEKAKDGAEKIKDDAEKKKEELMEKAAPALEANALNAKKQEIESRYAAEVAVVEEKYKVQLEDNAKKVALATEENDSSMIASLKEDNVDILKEKAEELANINKNKDTELEVVNNELKALAEKSAKSNAKVDDFLNSTKEATDAVSLTSLEKQMYAEKDTTENQVIIKNVRREIAARDAIDASSVSINVIAQLPKKKEKIEELNDGVITVEYSPSVNISVEMDIEIMRAMVNSLRLEAVKLRKEASDALAKSSNIETKPGTSNIENFDIDNYSYAKKCKEGGLGGIMGKLNNAAGKITSGEGIGGVNLNDIKKAKEEISNAKI